MITACIKTEVIYKKIAWLISRLSQHLCVVIEVKHYKESITVSCVSHTEEMNGLKCTLKDK